MFKGKVIDSLIISRILKLFVSLAHLLFHSSPVAVLVMSEACVTEAVSGSA